MKILLLDLGEKRKENNEPIGLKCIASHLESETGIIADIKWLNMDYDITNIVNYDLIGLSMSIGALPLFEKIYNMALPNQVIVAGGSIPTFAYTQLLELFENVICCIGEGEETFLDLVRYYRNNASANDTIVREISDIPNLAFKKDGKLVVTERKPFDIKTVKKIRRRSDIINFILNTNGIARIEASRGCCWGKCAFCCVSAKYSDPSWRGFSINKITEELIELSDLGIRSPYFTDEDFFGKKPQRVKELAEAIFELKQAGKINPHMDFFIAIMSTDISNDEGKSALIEFKKAGLREVFMGIESMEGRQLKRFNKIAKTEHNRNAINFLKSIGLQIDIGFILFDPQLTIQELSDNIEYIANLELSKYDARSIKRLRIQPYTKYADSLISTLKQPLDLNNIEYPYDFIDSDVKNIYKNYELWENKFKDIIWRFQALTRGERVPQREILKENLGEIRNIDFDYLKMLTSFVRGVISRQEHDRHLIELENKKISTIKAFETLLHKEL
jgi:radical SAM superfamily enzyme YgiQ (UPF0313 family)